MSRQFVQPPSPLLFPRFSPPQSETVNRSDVRRFSSSAAVSGKRGPAQNPPWLPAPASRLTPSLFWPNQRRSSARSISSDHSKPSLPQMPSTQPPALSSLSTSPTPWALCTNPGNQATYAAPTAPTSTALQLNCRRLAHLCQQKGIRQEWI